MLYIFSFIIGGLITVVLYGKVPMLVLLTISLIVGGLIGYIYNKIQQKKAERAYVEMLKRIRTYNQEIES